MQFDVVRLLPLGGLYYYGKDNGENCFLAKARGFVYPGSEIYGGLANTWDYGNLGVELKNNVKKAWWQKFVQESPYNVGVDCAILMNPQTWVASVILVDFLIH